MTAPSLQHIDISIEKVVRERTVVGVSVLDTAALLTARLDSTNVALDPQVADRVRRRLDLYLMPLMCLLYFMAFADKICLGQSAILGIQASAHLNQSQFNWLGAVFYFAYLAFQYPQNIALLYFPVGRWISLNVFIWAIALLCHAACKSFGALLGVRIIMGMCEGAIIPGFMIIVSMFYTREEQIRRLGCIYMMPGISAIVLGFISFGVLHIRTGTLVPWQWLMVITGLMTLVTAVVFWLLFPDSPTNAHFLSPGERIVAVQRIRVNQAGVENKHFKRQQFVETFHDPKTWLFALFAGLITVANSLTNQRQIIVNQFGFSTFQTTLIGCVDGILEAAILWFGPTLASSRCGRCYAAILLFVPSLLGSLLVSFLPAHNRFGLLFSYWLSTFFVAPFAICLSWVTAVTAGHTKRMITNAIVMIAFAIGSAVGSFMWRAKYQPRNHIPWAVLSGIAISCSSVLLITRLYLARENQLRDQEEHDSRYDNVYVTHDGVEKQVEKAFLDLTDRQNREFRYVL